jgi:hypothetical protein
MCVNGMGWDGMGWDGMGWDGMGCVQVLADPDRRRGYDEGVDIKVKRGRKDEDDDSEEEVS